MPAEDSQRAPSRVGHENHESPSIAVTASNGDA
jgi:hypothetical protein